MRNSLIVVCLMALCSFVKGQDYEFFISFSDKNGTLHSTADPSTFLSTESIERRQNQSIDIVFNDLPVSQDYVDSLGVAGISVLHQSRWMNGVIARGDSMTIEALESKPFITAVKAIGNSLALRPGTESKFEMPAVKGYGPATNQIEMLGADLLHGEGYLGQGITIAVIDDGFTNVNSGSAFADLINDGRIEYTYDIHGRSDHVYGFDTHGTFVLSAISGIPGDTIGIAPAANIVLLRSEVLTFEQPLEEYYWVIAAEKADSIGVDIINTSLGYNTFDAPFENHPYSDLDGNTAVMTIASDIAASKGMLIVNSAGNEGNSSWNHILVPADGDSVLTVGAVNSSEIYASFSSEGPTSDGRIKPEVSCKGQSATVSSGSGTTNGNGTSFASPIMAGFAALLWQKNPTLTAMELRQLLIELGDQYDTPDNLKGYGVPKYDVLTSLNEEQFSYDKFIGKVYRLIDLSGRIVESGVFEGEEFLQVSGVYILKFENYSTLIGLNVH